MTASPLRRLAVDAGAQTETATSSKHEPSFKGLDPARVLFPSAAFTVRDALDYYRAISKFILSHLRDRPLSFKRISGERCSRSIDRQ